VASLGTGLVTAEMTMKAEEVAVVMEAEAMSATSVAKVDILLGSVQILKMVVIAVALVEVDGALVAMTVDLVDEIQENATSVERRVILHETAMIMKNLQEGEVLATTAKTRATWRGTAPRAAPATTVTTRATRPATVLTPSTKGPGDPALVAASVVATRSATTAGE